MTPRIVYAILGTATLWLAVVLRTIAGGGYELALLIVLGLGLLCACADTQGRRG